MNPDEWNASSSKSILYNEVMRRSTERFFVCECRFGTFKLRSALENVFLLEAHNCDRVKTLSYEKVRIPLPELTPRGRNRIYIPDFLVNDEHLVECKSTSSMRGKEVRAKAAEAEKYAENRDWLYHMLDYSDFNEFFALL